MWLHKIDHWATYAIICCACNNPYFAAIGPYVHGDVIFVATFYGSVYIDMHLTCLLNTGKHKEDGNIVRQKRTISMGQLEDMQIFVRIVEAGFAM